MVTLTGPDECGQATPDSPLPPWKPHHGSESARSSEQEASLLSETQVLPPLWGEPLHWRQHAFLFMSLCLTLVLKLPPPKRGYLKPLPAVPQGHGRHHPAPFSLVIPCHRQRAPFLPTLFKALLSLPTAPSLSFLSSGLPGVWLKEAAPSLTLWSNIPHDYFSECPNPKDHVLGLLAGGLRAHSSDEFCQWRGGSRAGLRQGMAWSSILVSPSAPCPGGH